MNKLSQLSGYSINEMENQEMMSVLVEEEKPMKPLSTAITSSSSSPSSNSNAIWANLKPFAHGGAAGMLQYSLCCLLRPELLAKVNISLPPSLAYYNAWLKVFSLHSLTSPFLLYQFLLHILMILKFIYKLAFMSFLVLVFHYCLLFIGRLQILCNSYTPCDYLALSQG